MNAVQVTFTKMVEIKLMKISYDCIYHLYIIQFTTLAKWWLTYWTTTNLNFVRAIVQAKLKGLKKIRITHSNVPVVLRFKGLATFWYF